MIRIADEVGIERGVGGIVALDVTSAVLHRHAEGRSALEDFDDGFYFRVVVPPIRTHPRARSMGNGNAARAAADCKPVTTTSSAVRTDVH